MFRRCIRGFQGVTPTTLLQKAPAFSPRKKIREVLEECREFDKKENLERYSDLLEPFQIQTAKDWLDLSDATKAKIQMAGLPESVINSLNTAVRQGLLLPQFKYADAVNFLDTPEHHKHFEVQTILQHAQTVDNDWVLTRQNCESLCVNYQIMVELTQKYYLKRWTPKVTEKRKPKKKTEKTEETDPFPKTHKLVDLAAAIKRRNIEAHVIADYPPDSLSYVTNCGEHTKYKGTRISCGVFYYHTRAVDPYVMSLWDVMKACKPLN